MKTNFTILLIFLSTLFCWANNLTDSDKNSYFVKFTDKNGTIYSIDKPEEFLSDKSIERRRKLQIAIDSTDLPLSQIYVDSIISYGAAIQHQIKWQNGVIADMTTDVATQIETLGFVDMVEITKIVSYDAQNVISSTLKSDATSAVSFEDTEAQKIQIGLDQLHDLGFRGEGITIAVIDAGYENADEMAVFDSIRHNGQLLGTYDFADPTSNIYDEDYHGTYVLSTMAANDPNLMIGTAPDANYYLLRTEIAATEWLIEIDLFCRALEWADSAGVDVVNTSLGYSQFDYSGMDFTYDDLDGKTIRSSVSSAMAVEKGMFLVNSAGNEGNSSWHYIASPADAEGVLTVGGVDSQGYASYFSSYGPTADGRIKPEVVARASACAVVFTTNYVISANGTSFSSPIITGMVASLMSALPDITPAELYTKICESSSQYSSPTDNLGYGIPNAMNVYSSLSSVVENITKENYIYITQDSNRIQLHNISDNAFVKIYDIKGAIIYADYIGNEEYINVSGWNSGIYIIQIADHKNLFNSKFVITN